MTGGSDVLVVGAGSAGCVLAARLSEDGTRRVTLLEAGGGDANPLFRVPLMTGVLLRSRYANWFYHTEPEPGLDGRRSFWARGRVLGGSSTINGMVWARGRPSDYDGWAQAGLPGWSWDDALAGFRRIERFQHGASDWHGGAGPLPVTDAGVRHPLLDAFVAAGVQAGHPPTGDFNAPPFEGVGRYHFTIAGGQRWSAARAYLAPARTRPNLRVVTRAQALRLLVADGRVTGVATTKGMFAADEVVLCGGTINSPQLLLLSGIGPAEELHALGIAPLVDLPGVGRNLQDHLLVRVEHACTQPITLQSLTRLDRAAAALLRALVLRSGPATSFPLAAGFFLRSDPGLEEPDLQGHFLPGLTTATLRVPGLAGPARAGDAHGFMANVTQMRPHSRGRVTPAQRRPAGAAGDRTAVFVRPAGWRRAAAGRAAPARHLRATGVRRGARGGAGARPRRADRRRDGCVDRPHGRHDVPSRRHLPHGHRQRSGRGGGRTAAGARRGRAAGGRRLRHAAHHQRQHQRPGHPDRPSLRRLHDRSVKRVACHAPLVEGGAPAGVRTMHDVVIRGGTIVDGTGAPAFTGDVAVDGDRIAAVGGKAGPARRDIDADGLLVTPGWVDIHTHYDGQATWDPVLAPSSWNGATTILFGNCGVGFAPVRKRDRQSLIDLMEGVEDIPGIALAEGLKWDWETFPQFLDVLEGMPRTIDVAAQVPHHPLRVYVMGDRAIRREAATPADIQAMRDLTEEALHAGAFGFTTSRTDQHKTTAGELVPGRYAEDVELLGIGAALGAAGAGTFGMLSEFEDEASEFAWMRQFHRDTGRPLWFLLTDRASDPQRWRRLMERTHAARADGAAISAQVAARQVGLILGLRTTLNPFTAKPGFVALAGLDPAARLHRLRDPAVRAQILGEPDSEALLAKLPPLNRAIATQFDRLFVLGDPPDYEPPPERSIAFMADAGRHAARRLRL